MTELRGAMRKAGCSTPFINYVLRLLKNEEIDWNDWATEITQHEVNIRLLNGYVIKIYD